MHSVVSHDPTHYFFFLLAGFPDPAQRFLLPEGGVLSTSGGRCIIIIPFIRVAV